MKVLEEKVVGKSNKEWAKDFLSGKYRVRVSVDVMNTSNDSEDLFGFLQLDSNPKART